jgi:hypothetical protein
MRWFIIEKKDPLKSFLSPVLMSPVLILMFPARPEVEMLNRFEILPVVEISTDLFRTVFATPSISCLRYLTESARTSISLLSSASFLLATYNDPYISDKELR